MTIYDVGDRVNVTTSVAAGSPVVPVNATLTIQVTKPDNTLLTPPSVGNPAVGSYNADIDVTAPGNWRVLWTASGAAVGRDEYQFYVQPAGFRVVSVQDAKNHINKTASYTGDDNELRQFIDTAGELVDKLAGPTVNRTVVEYHSGGCRQIFPRQWPVVSVVSVVETWPGGPNYTLNALADLGVTAGTGYDFTFDPGSGAITRRINSYAGAFPPGDLNVKVTYVAGRPQPWPSLVRMASLDEVAYLWRTSQAGRGAGRPQIGGNDVTVEVAGFGPVPARVVGMLSGKRPPLAGA